MQSLFVDNLTVIDFAYFHPQRGIIGESLILNVELFGELNDEGMLFDFSYVKKRIKSSVDALIDHKFLVARQEHRLNIEQSPKQLTLKLTTDNGEEYCHISPHEAVFMVDTDLVDRMSIANVIKDEISKILPDNVSKVNIELLSEDIKGNFYHYSHGLKKHFGDCQRIAHGHRSKIKVWENGEFSKKWSAHVAELWQDIYLATEEDIKKREIINGQQFLTFEYHANQGLFQLTLPENRCFLMTTDTTVELIASFLAGYLKSKCLGSTFKVKAYEGIDKGACFESS